MPEPTCIDLQARFGEEFRIQLDPAAGERSTDPWMLTIPCVYGAIYPHGGDRLGVETESKRIRNWWGDSTKPSPALGQRVTRRW